MRGASREPSSEGMDLKNAKAQVDSLRERVKSLGETLSLLTELEPALRKKYMTIENDWGYRAWDIDGMKAALEFRRLEKAHKKYATKPVVSETTNSKKE